MRYWALWTLLKLAEDGKLINSWFNYLSMIVTKLKLRNNLLTGKFVKMMIQDGKMKSMDDLSAAASEDNCSKCSLELQELWDILSKKFNR